MISSQMGSRQAIAEAFDLSRWASWINSLKPLFVFLLCLPFAVAVAGLLADLVRKHASASAPPSVDHRATKD